MTGKTGSLSRPCLQTCLERHTKLTEIFTQNVQISVSQFKQTP